MAKEISKMFHEIICSGKRKMIKETLKMYHYPLFGSLNNG